MDMGMMGQGRTPCVEDSGEPDAGAEMLGVSAADLKRIAYTTDFELAEARMAGLGLAPGRLVGAEDIRDLQSFPGHDAVRLAAPL